MDYQLTVSLDEYCLQHAHLKNWGGRNKYGRHNTFVHLSRATEQESTVE